MSKVAETVRTTKIEVEIPTSMIYRLANVLDVPVAVAEGEVSSILRSCFVQYLSQAIGYHSS